MCRVYNLCLNLVYKTDCFSSLNYVRFFSQEHVCSYMFLENIHLT